MRALKTIGTLIVVLALVGLPCAWAEVPQIITYQGLLRDGNGDPLNGAFNLTVNIYTVESGGTAVWTEEHTGVNVEAGVFDIRMGETTAFDGNVDFTQSNWLGLAVNGGPEMTPRIMFATVPTAFVAKTVEDDALTAAKIKSGQVVKSVNGLKDDVVLSAGSNITLSPSGNTISISATTPPPVSCGWSGWKPDTGSCPANYAPTAVIAIRLYCSSGKVTQAEYASVIVKCEYIPPDPW